MRPTASPLATQARRDVYADLLSQAITGELIGMANYAAMTELCRDPESQEEAVEHAFNERGHAAAFKRVARDLGLVDYWRARGWPAQCHPAGTDDFACE